MTIQYLFYILFGYLSGSVLYGYLLPKYIKKIDIPSEVPASMHRILSVLQRREMHLPLPDSDPDFLL